MGGEHVKEGVVLTHQRLCRAPASGAFPEGDVPRPRHRAAPSPAGRERRDTGGRRRRESPPGRRDLHAVAVPRALDPRVDPAGDRLRLLRSERDQLGAVGHRDTVGVPVDHEDQVVEAVRDHADGVLRGATGRRRFLQRCHTDRPGRRVRRGHLLRVGQ